MEDLYNKLHDVLYHLDYVYGFEMVPCSIPSNHFQYLKRNFYLWVKNKISVRLFYFLRDKVSPIRYLDERPNKEIWLKYRPNDRTECEIEISPIPIESSIYVSDSKGISKPDINGDNFSVTIRHSYGEFGHMPFLMNSNTGIECINAHLSDLPVFKQKLREYRLNNILK